MRSRSVPRSHPDHSTSRNGRRVALGAAATIFALGAGALVAPAAHAEETQVQILATNDFHGRILPDGAAQAGAAVLAGAVKQLRASNPNTVFAAAGDLIGASTFESYIQKDKPTIDALNAAGLEVSAVGNHELDQGYADLVDRVMAPYDAVKNPYGGAQWQYISANLKMKATGDDAVPATWIKEFGDVEVGFVGAVTEELPALVSPAGIADMNVAPIVESVNTEAAALVAEGADLVVMLVHEGAPSTDCATMDDSGTWANIVNNVSPDVDAIVSGHTHLAYNCSFPVQEWVDAGRTVTDRPVVSAGQYGTNLNQLLFTVDGATGEVSAKSQTILPLVTTPAYPADAAVAELVAKAKADAAGPGAQPLGQIAGPFNRARLGDGVTDYRGGESTLGNLVAEVQQWATEEPESGGAQIAFMNPGGLRTDMKGTGADGDPYPRTVTYRQAADVQPFANTLVNMQLTGAQIKTALEQQWQRDQFNIVPSRPFLRLGVSEGFEYTYTQETESVVSLDNPATPIDESALPPNEEARGTVTGMWLNDVPIDLDASYSVTVNSFLASGGDNFGEFANGAGKRDTGKIDLATMVDYLDQFASSAPLPVNYSQRAVEVAFPEDAPASYPAGSTVAFDVRSWTMTNPTDVKDSEVIVSLGDTVLGAFALDNTIGSDPKVESALYDNYGTTSVSVQLPAGVPAGPTQLTLTGAATGTSIVVPITVLEKVASSTLAWPSTVLAKKGTPVKYTLRVSAGDEVPTGVVTVYDRSKAIATVTLTEADNGRVQITLPTLNRGLHLLSAKYEGSDLVKASVSPRVPLIIR